MAKKQNKESPEKQFERFRQKVEDMVDAGELNPTEAEERFEWAMRRIATPKEGS
jgi:polyhydroxyalkanoate synthesis regulator phasin